MVECEVNEKEVFEFADEIRNWASEIKPAESEEDEVCELDNGRLDMTSDIGKFVEFEVCEEWKVTNFRWDLAREVACEDGEGVDAVRGGVTCDTIPVTTIGVWVPRGKDVRVVEGLFDFE